MTVYIDAFDYDIILNKYVFIIKISVYKYILIYKGGILLQVFPATCRKYCPEILSYP